MNYSQKFIDLVKSKQFGYMGTGNPNAKMLMIGREPAIDKEDRSSPYKGQKCRVRRELKQKDAESIIGGDGREKKNPSAFQ